MSNPPNVSALLDDLTLNDSQGQTNKKQQKINK